MPKPLFTVFAISLLFASCSQNNVTEDNSLGVYFDSAGVKGTFGLFDNGQGHFTIYNLPRFSDSTYQPAGTFQILLSLVGIQTGVIKDDSAVIHPDTGATGANLTLIQAFQNSSDKAFGILARHIGKDTLQKWVDSLGYGNKNLNGPIDSVWFNNHLKLTSDEELGLVKKLYFDQLHFFQRSQKIVRRMMLLESNANYLLSYVAGQGVKEDGHTIGWITGWVEENKHPYFFVLNLESPGPDRDMREIGLPVLKKILTRLGFFQGKK